MDMEPKPLRPSFQYAGLSQPIIYWLQVQTIETSQLTTNN